MYNTFWLYFLFLLGNLENKVQFESSGLGVKNQVSSLFQFT